MSFSLLLPNQSLKQQWSNSSSNWTQKSTPDLRSMSETEVTLQCNDMTEAMKTECIINRMTVSITIKTLDLKEIETVSIETFILSLTFLVKVNIRLYISLNISLFIVSSLFLCQTVLFRVNFKAFFLFVLQIKTLCLIIISSDLLIQLWFHCRPLLKIKTSCYSLH